MELITKTSRIHGSEINHAEIGEQSLVDSKGKAERARIEHTVRMLPDAPHHEEAVVELRLGDMSMVVRACFDRRGSLGIMPQAFVSLISAEDEDDQSHVAVEHLPGQGWTATVTKPIRVEVTDPRADANERAWERMGRVE